MAERRGWVVPVVAAIATLSALAGAAMAESADDRLRDQRRQLRAMVFLLDEYRGGLGAAEDPLRQMAGWQAEQLALVDRLSGRPAAAGGRLAAAEHHLAEMTRRLAEAVDRLALPPRRHGGTARASRSRSGAVNVAEGGPERAGALVAGGSAAPVLALLAERLRPLDLLGQLLRALPLDRPLDSYILTSGFGWRRDPFNRRRRAMHSGFDLMAPLGTPVHATGPGRVVYSGRRGAYGKMVEIDHGFGIHTRYGHLRSLPVRVGQQVRAGQIIGRVGLTGRTTGPHLHYEIQLDGRARNPGPFLQAAGTP